MEPFAAVFELPAVKAQADRADAAIWRLRWTQAGIGTVVQWNQIRVIVMANLLWLYPATPAAAAWLHDQIPALGRQISDHFDDVVVITLNARPYAVRWSEEIWAYRIRHLVIAKGGADWSEHFKPKLDPALTQAIEQRIERGIRRDLAAWGQLPDDLHEPSPFLVLADPGRAFATPAIAAGNRSNKPIHVLVRDNVMVLSKLRIEGAIFVGQLTSLGYGRLLRIRGPKILSAGTRHRLPG